MMLEITDVMIYRYGQPAEYISAYISKTYRLKQFTRVTFCDSGLELVVFCSWATEGCFLLHWDSGCSPPHTLHA